MKINPKKLIRTFIVPLTFTAMAAAFWLTFGEDGYWWWPILILVIFTFNFGLKKAEKIYKKPAKQ